MKLGVRYRKQNHLATSNRLFLSGFYPRPLKIGPENSAEASDIENENPGIRCGEKMKRWQNIIDFKTWLKRLCRRMSVIPKDVFMETLGKWRGEGKPWDLFTDFRFLLIFRIFSLQNTSEKIFR